MITMSIIMQTSLYLFLFQYVGFYVVEIFSSASWHPVIDMNVMAHCLSPSVTIKGMELSELMNYPGLEALPLSNI